MQAETQSIRGLDKTRLTRAAAVSGGVALGCATKERSARKECKKCTGRNLHILPTARASPVWWCLLLPLFSSFFTQHPRFFVFSCLGDG